MKHQLMIAAALALCTAYGTTQTLPIQMKYEGGTGSGFFGGDYRDGNTARNIGTGVAVTLTEDTRIEQFAFSFGDFENDETGDPAEVTLVYAMRNADGSLIAMEEVTMADTFTGGWIHWKNIGQTVTAPGPVIFTCFVKDGHTNYTTGSVNGDTDAGDDVSVKYACSQSDDPYNMDTWSNWYEHTWDNHYWLQGRPQMGPTPPASIVMVYQSGSGSGFFGGDYRDGNTARNIGTGVGVTIDTAINVQEVSLSFGAFENDETGAAAEATLVFTLRDTDGSALKTGEVTVPSAFTGGWVTWTGINQTVDAPGPVIVTCYVKDGETNYTTGSSNGDTDAGDASSVRYACSQSDTPYDMDTWTNWYDHSWDAYYMLKGTMVTPVSGISDGTSLPSPALTGMTAHPNPCTGSITISSIDGADGIVIRGLDGTEVFSSAAGTVTWDGRDISGARVQPGAYIVRLTKDSRTAGTGIILMK